MKLDAASRRSGDRRQRFAVEQKRQIVEATLAPGASVARVAREFAVKNQVFAWRRAYKQGLLEDRGSRGLELLPVHIASHRDEASPVTEPGPPRSGAIHMEFPGKVLLSVEGTPRAESLRIILEALLR